MTITGTSHFVSLARAVDYYQSQGDDRAQARETVKHKLAAGEIHIGRPKCKANETVSINDEGRYVIITP